MVVDDSAVIRSFLTKALEADPGIRVVATASNGKHALSALSRTSVEVVVLDIQMPVMDGITALPKLIETCPTAKIIVASTLSRANAEITLKALQAGASDYVTKPSAKEEIRSSAEFQRELVAKVKALGGSARSKSGQGCSPSQQIGSFARTKTVTEARTASIARPRIMRSPMVTLPPEIIAIGSSTGGPNALTSVIGSLGGRIPQPIVVTQHMPATFTTLLAENISRVTGYPCIETVDGCELVGGKIYLAPGNYHMLVAKEEGRKVLRLSQSPPENYCRPSVDPMLRSLVAAFGARVFVVILTGMGSDGLEGCRAVTNAGGSVVAQDEATSVVWGMPGAVANAGLCSSILPLDEIGPIIRKSAMRTAA